MNKKENKINKYKEGVKILINSDLELKSIKTFIGREGEGASANIYWKGKRVGTYLDEANGGEEYIDFDHKNPLCDEAWEFIQSLPKFSHNEWLESVNHRSEPIGDGKDDVRDSSWKWYWASALITNFHCKKDLKKFCRTACVFNTEKECFVTWGGIKNNEVDTKTFNFKEEKGITFRDFISKHKKECVVINGMPINKAMEYYSLAK